MPLDLRDLPEQLSSLQRINQRRTLIERELGVDLSFLEPHPTIVGEAEKKNCEQMFGVVPLPVGYAGPLSLVFSNNQKQDIHLPLATTEGALVASVNRGCKAASVSGAKIMRSVDHGITRTLVFSLRSKESVCRMQNIVCSISSIDGMISILRKEESSWKAAAEATSGHLKIIGYDIDVQKKYVFLTIAADTDAAMGMNMVTIAAQAIADWMQATHPEVECVTIAGNIDSDKKPSKRTHDRGRGYEVVASVDLSAETIRDVLKTTPEAMLAVADAKLKAGSTLAGAIGANLHAANIIAALYLALGQDAAHVVEGSLADTSVEKQGTGLKISVRIPAIIVGVRGGGTSLPAQSKLLGLLLKSKSGLHPKKQLAESIAAAVLAGEISLLAAQAGHQLAGAHKTLGR